MRWILLLSSPCYPWGSIAHWWLAHVNLGHGSKPSDTGGQILSPTLHSSAGERMRSVPGDRELCAVPIQLCIYNCAYTTVVYVSDHFGNSNRTLPRAGQDGTHLWGNIRQMGTKRQADQKVGGPGKAHHTMTPLTWRGPVTPKQPLELWAGGARKQRTGIRNTKTSMVPDPVPSCPIRVQEKQGRKQKQQPTLNTEVGQVQGKGYALVPYCCYNQLQQI